MIVGRLFGIGVGPGDPELLTMKAVRALKIADVVFYDRLVGDAALRLIPAGAARIPVGKQSGRHPIPQPAHNSLPVGARSSEIRSVEPWQDMPCVSGVSSATPKPCCRRC